jgi:hypothetical protein
MEDLNQVIETEISLLSPEGGEVANLTAPFGEPEAWPQVWSPGEVLTKTWSIPLSASISFQPTLRISVWLNGERLVPLDSSGGPVESDLPLLISNNS